MQHVVRVSCLYKMASNDQNSCMRSINLDGNESLEADMVNKCDGRVRVGRLATKKRKLQLLAAQAREKRRSQSVPAFTASPDTVTGDSDVAVPVPSTSTSVTDCQTGASATTSDSVAVVATGTAAMPSCTSRRKLALLRCANEPGLIDQDVAVRVTEMTAPLPLPVSVTILVVSCVLFVC